jgi:hypothetical protein
LSRTGSASVFFRFGIVSWCLDALVRNYVGIMHRIEPTSSVIESSRSLNMEALQRLEYEISQWLQVSVHPHRFGGREFLVGNAEVGHIHAGGIVDIPFPRTVRDALLAEGLTEEHHWVPNSGWITFQMRGEKDLIHALWLMRLSYLRYALKTSTDPQKLFEQESEELRLSPRFKSLLEPFVPKTPKQVPAEPVPA